jgi:hypothetical protein
MQPVGTFQYKNMQPVEIFQCKVSSQEGYFSVNSSVKDAIRRDIPVQNMQSVGVFQYKICSQ